MTVVVVAGSLFAVVAAIVRWAQRTDDVHIKARARAEADRAAHHFEGDQPK